MPEGKVYEIPEPGFKWFKTKLEKLGKRAEKLVGEKLTLMVVGYHKEEDKTSRFYNQKIMEVFVAFPEPKLNGWEFVARIDHANEVGNVIRSVGEREVPEMYRNRAPICDHCGYKRKRRDSFVVFHAETADYKQVGTGCLKDFLGHGDADRWAKVAEMIAGVGELVRGSRDTGVTGELQDRRWFNVEDYCAAAAQSVLERGWVSRKVSEERDVQSTASHAWAFMHYDMQADVTDEARELADKALEDARIERPNMNDYQHNCFVIANAAAMESRSAGIAASIVGVYFNKNKPRATAPQGVSEHQGLLGQKIERNVTLTGVYTGEFSVRHQFVDDEGNTFVWFASSDNLGRYRDQKIRIKGTVKAHTEFRNIKQTLINRVKVVEVFNEAGVPQSHSRCPLLNPA